MAIMHGAHSNIAKKSSQVLNVVMEKQSTCLICIIYPGKHNGTLFSTYEARTEQLERTQNLLIWTKQLQ